MFGILLSAGNALLGWLVRGVLVKFVVMVALYWIVAELVGVMASWLPTGAGLTSAFGGISAATWYFLDLFAFSNGVPLLIAALVTRFLIRRIPVIG
ncbi:DUF2523 family protein [Pseudomonas extremaustralis]|uniref:DUF2523 family protein n=1 Tax=Pseudomonas TaxID=286 RepID=UPI0016553F17|nr:MULTISPECIES: DUF2523 family protein [Pseudomonas]MBC8787633.1 DUF2523 domain-containing protein [Pseudomonas fluorescens]MDG2965633.1 DUF2523 family protein [Pseudomonas extremaustralis]MDG2965645.1 DUF2523 family protein [Pseudomonas extremaustralis]